MSRPMALSLVLIVLILTSQAEWRQHPKTNLELTAAVIKQQQAASAREVIKEQIILSQEKQIFILNDLVKSLQRELVQCRQSVIKNRTELANVQIEAANYTREEYD